MNNYHLKGILQNDGWHKNVAISTDKLGEITSIYPAKNNNNNAIEINGYAIPGFQNAHSHWGRGIPHFGGLVLVLGCTGTERSITSSLPYISLVLFCTDMYSIFLSCILDLARPELISKHHELIST